MLILIKEINANLDGICFLNPFLRVGNMRDIAKQLYEQGCNIVTLNARKEPLVKWTQWQTQRQTPEEFEALPWDRAEAYAVICGLKLENGLYFGAIDVDVKNISEEAKKKGEQFENLLKIVTEIEETPSKGKHYIYYSEKPIKTDNKAHEFAGIEVLGERKLCVMAPSKGYRKLNDNTPRIVESLNQLADSNLKRIGFKSRRHRRNDVVSSKMKKGKIRPCIHEAMKREHLFYSGATQAEIEILFAKYNSWEGPNYDPEKTRYQINHLISKPYPRFSCATIEDNELCLGPDKCPHREGEVILIPSIEGFLDAEGKFNPVFFAKYLLQTLDFKTTRDNETLYVYDGKTGIYKPQGEVVVKEEMVKALDEATRQRHLADVLFFIRGSTYFDRIHNPLGKVAVENGILDLETKQLEPFTPEVFLTTYLPVSYDPAAECPKIQQFIIDVVGKEQLDLIQETIGYCLYKAMPHHKALMLIGDGANGKSTLLELIKKFLGEENVSNASLQSICYHRFTVAQLYNKLANICADLPDSALKQTGPFKMLTGNDTIEGEEKFKQPFSFKNHAKLFFSANKVPETIDDTTAFFRRWILIACNNVFIGEKCNPNILKEISTSEEMSGLLNFALQGLERLLKNNKFSTSENIEELRTQYIRKSNSAKAFIEEQLIYEPDPKAFIIATELYEKYILFCRANNLPSMQKRFLTQNMQQHLPQAKYTTQRVDPKKKLAKVWQFVKLVTFVTDPLFNSPELNFSSVTFSRSKTNGVECLNGNQVTKVTKIESGESEKSLRKSNKESEATTCPLCNGLLPRDMSNTTTWEGKVVHLQPCYVDLMAGRLRHED